MGHGCLDFAGVPGDWDAEQVAPEGARGIGGQAEDQVDGLAYHAEDGGGDHTHNKDNDKDNDPGKDKDPRTAAAKAKDFSKDKAKDNVTAADEDVELRSTTPTQASPAKKSPPTKQVTGKATVRAALLGRHAGNGNGRGRAGTKR